MMLWELEREGKMIMIMVATHMISHSGNSLDLCIDWTNIWGLKVAPCRSDESQKDIFLSFQVICLF